MNAARWEVRNLESVVHRLKAQCEEYQAGLRGPADADTTNLVSEWEAFKGLLLKMHAMRTGEIDPVSLLVAYFTCDGRTEATYLIEVGCWRCYYDLDFRHHIATALYVQHESEDLARRQQLRWSRGGQIS